MRKYCQKQFWWRWKQWLQKFAKTFQSEMMDVEAYMAFSLKSFNAQISFYLLQTFVWQQMYFTKIIEEQKHPQQEDGCGNLHCILLCISAYPHICISVLKLLLVNGKFCIPCLVYLTRRCFLAVVNYWANPHTTQPFI